MVKLKTTETLPLDLCGRSGRKNIKKYKKNPDKLTFLEISSLGLL